MIIMSWEHIEPDVWLETLQEGAAYALDGVLEVVRDTGCPDELPQLACVAATVSEINSSEPEDLEGTDADSVVVGYRVDVDVAAIRRLVDEVWGPGASERLGDPVWTSAEVSL